MIFPFSYSGSAKWISTFSLLPPYWLNSLNAASASSNSYSDFFVGSSTSRIHHDLFQVDRPPFTRSISSVKSAFSAFLEPRISSSFFWIIVKLKSRFFFPTPINTTRPPNAAASIQILECGRKPHRFDTYVKSMMIARNFSHTICEILFTVIFDHARKSKCMVCVLQLFFRNNPQYTLLRLLPLPQPPQARRSFRRRSQAPCLLFGYPILTHRDS